MRDRVRTLLVFAAAALVLTAGLGGYGLWDPDEGRHAAIARALYAADTWRGWIVPSHNFADYHDKPILYYWLTALAYAVAGPNELGARLVPALAALATLVVVFRWTSAVWDSRTARWAALVLVTSVGFLGLGRYGNLDMLLTWWTTAGILAAERFTAAPHRRGFLVIAAAAAGFGMLTKGLEAPLFIAAVALVHAVVARRPLPGPRAWATAAAVFVLVAGPWCVATAVVDPGYLPEFLLVHHVARFTSTGTTFHPGPWWYYGPALALMLFPWSLLLPSALARPAVRRDPGLLLCASWAAIVIGVFSLSHGKLATYILPALPPLAILVARGLDGIETATQRRLAAGGLVLLVLALGATLPIAWQVEHRRWSVVMAEMAPSLAALAAAGIVLVAVWRLCGLTAATRVIAPAVMAVALVFYVRGAPAVSRMASELAMADAIASRIDAPIVSYEVTPASLMFYVERPIVRVSRPAALRRALADQHFVWIVTSPRHVAELARITPVYPWVGTGRHVLYATAPPATMAAAASGTTATN